MMMCQKDRPADEDLKYSRDLYVMDSIMLPV